MRNVGLWLYANGGGAEIQEKMIRLLREREIETVTGLDMRFATADKNGIICNGTAM